MAILKQINAAIQKVEPLVELVRDKGYCYYVFDNGAPESTLTTPVFYVGDRVIFETKSVMVPFLNQQSKDRWIEDGIEFGQCIRKTHDLPEASV